MQKTIKKAINKGLFLAGQVSLLALAAFLFFPFMASAEGVVSASTGPAAASINGADLFASVNPNGSGTFAWFEYGPGSSLTLSTNKRYISSLASDSVVSFKLDGLGVNKVYAYRVVAYNAYGTAEGQVRTFTTTPTAGVQQIISPSSLPYYDNNTYGVVSSVVITKPATNISYYTARLNATVPPGNNASFTSGWFEFGPTRAFGISTRAQNLGSYGYINYFEDITGLTPGMIYYYRAVIQNQNGIQYGSILTFHTPTLYEDTIVPTTYKTVYTAKSAVYTPAPKPLATPECAIPLFAVIAITPADSTVSPGQIYAYTLRIHNDSSASMRNTDITVMLPMKLTYQARVGSGFVENGGVLVSRGNDIAPFADKDFSFSVRVGGGAQHNDSLPITAIARFTRNGSTSEDAIGYTFASVYRVANPAPAALTASGASSLPGQIIPWLIAVILLMAIVFVGVLLYGAYQKRKNEVEKGM